MKHAIKYLWLALFVTGCASNSDNVEQLIKQKADACKTADCTIKISDITPFKWDEMYVFNSAVPKADLERAIGVACPDYVEGTRPLIFFDKKKMVHFECNPDALTKGSKGQIIYAYSVGLMAKIYHPSEAVFKANVEKAGPKTYYNLRPL
jgi:hypothetical protein